MAHQYSATFERAGRFIARHAVAVILIWVAIGISVNVAWPQLDRVANEHSVSPLPSAKVSPSLKAMRDMSEAFGQKNADNAIVIVMASDRGFDREAQSLYDALLQRLRADTGNVAYVQDVLSNPDVRSNPIARDQVMSKDGKAWLVSATLQGELGSPQSARASRQVNNLVEQTFKGTSVQAEVTGATATTTDMAAAGASDIIKIGIITVILISIILLIVFRTPTTALLPVIVMGFSVVVARGVVAGLADAGAIPISSVSGALMMAVLMGASVNYTVFLISRYHENIRRGEDPTDALAHACGSMTRVILATAATVAIANLAQLTAKLKFLAASGPCVAIAIVVGFLVVTTLLPAVLTVAARFGKCMPGPDRTGRYWHRVGVLVVRHPIRVFAFSLVLLVTLATGMIFLKPSYDMQGQLPHNAPSNAGIRLLNEHFPGNRMMPQFVMVQSKSDLRSPQGLADLDQMAGRIAQLPGVDKVVGITRPDGNKLTQATLAWQIGFLGDQMGRLGRDASDQLGPQMDRLTRIADVVSSMMSDVDTDQLARLQQMVPQLMSMAQQQSGQIDKYQGLLDQLQQAAPLLQQVDQVGPSLDSLLDALNTSLPLIAPVSSALDGLSQCGQIAQCAQLRNQLGTLENLQQRGVVTTLKNLRSTLSSAAGDGGVEQLFAQLNSQLGTARGLLSQLPAMQQQYDSLNQGLQQLQALGVDPPMARNLSQRVAELNGQLQQSMSAMTEAAAYLQTVGRDASSPAASGFYLPTTILNNPTFETAATMFITPDGHTAMYLVQSSLNPYSLQAMSLSRQMQTVGRDATPNTALAGSTVSVGGFPSINADLRTAFNRDFNEIIIATLVIIAIVMCLLLRSVVAPLYLLGTVILTYLAAVGLGVLVFQQLLGQEISWAIPAMTFTLVVAVGADYNMLFISRLREESVRGTRIGLIRTVHHTGSVITSAGLVFAAAVMGMMAGSLLQMAQMGFIIGCGILLDTFVVRTLMVPAIAQAFGDASWWPSGRK